MWTTPPLVSLQECLADPSLPIGMRMRAAYFLRHLYSKEPKDREIIVQTLASGMKNEEHGSLMRHEMAYVLGQLRDEQACPHLEEVLLDEEDCVMVRHETAEALGAIGAVGSKTILEKIVKRHPGRPELSDTCRLALNVMEWRASSGDNADETEAPAACACMLNPYSSVDPAPPHPSHASKLPHELGDILCDPNLPIFERYRAMFSLRNLGGAPNVEQLCRALTSDTSSALLRHEVAYVLGQLQHPDSVEALEISLRRQDEHDMVRHESAEALGAIEGRWTDVERILTEFAKDENEVVRESCLVALDAADYWKSNEVNGEEVALSGPAEENPNSFAQTKALDAKASTASAVPNPILINHFNLEE